MTCFQHCRLMESIVSLYCRTTSCLVERDGIMSQVCLSLTLSRQELLHATLSDSAAQKLSCRTASFSEGSRWTLDSVKSEGVFWMRFERLLMSVLSLQSASNKELMQNTGIYLPYFGVRHLWCFFWVLTWSKRMCVITEGGKFVTSLLRLKGKLLYAELY